MNKAYVGCFHADPSVREINGLPGQVPQDQSDISFNATH